MWDFLPHSCLMSGFSRLTVWALLCISCFMMCHTFSAGCSSGLQASHCSTRILWLWSHTVIIHAECRFMWSCWNKVAHPWEMHCLDASICCIKGLGLLTSYSPSGVSAVPETSACAQELSICPGPQTVSCCALDLRLCPGSEPVLGTSDCVWCALYLRLCLTGPWTSACARDLSLCLGPKTVSGCAQDLSQCPGPQTVQLCPGLFFFIQVHIWFYRM